MAALRPQVAAATAPFSVSLFPSRFPAPAAASRAQPGPLGQRAAARPSEAPAAWDAPEARQSAPAGTVLPRVAERAVSALPQAAEHEGEAAAGAAPVAAAVERGGAAARGAGGGGGRGPC